MNRRRVVAVIAAFGLLLAGLLARAVDVCVVSADVFGPEARRQALRDLELTGPRGDIVDRAGAPLAVSVQVPSVYARPRAIEDRARVAERLGAALGAPFEEVFPLLTGARGFVWIRRWLSPEQARRVAELREPGVGLVQEPRRYYPDRELAAHVVGFVGHDGRGLEGIERAFDELLRGEPLSLTSLRDARGRPVMVGGIPSPAIAGAGRTLVLTLDRAVQYLAVEALRRALRDSGARHAAAVVLEPRTGEILALASLPTFNPNALRGHAPDDRRNRAVADSFEPGSTMKPFTMATAIEARVLSLTERIDCERGSWRVGKHRIRDVKPSGLLQAADILRFSSNIGAAKIGLRLGAERLRAGLARFGFGAATGSGLPGEVAGVLHPAGRWRKASVVTHSYGYGLSATLLQLAQAYAAIANGGELVRPRLVRAVLDRAGNVLHRYPREVRRRVVSPETARALTRMMVGVTEKGGTGTRAAIAGFEVAGKTGTAYKIGPGGYTDQRRVLFAGFVPAAEPRLVGVVLLDEPAGKVTGGAVAAPVWREIAAGVLRLWGIPPTRPTGEEPRVARASRPGRPAAPVATSPEPVPAGRVPDLRGLGLRRALQAAAAAGLGLEVAGSGRAVRQDPPPGVAAPPGASIRAVFAREDG